MGLYATERGMEVLTRQCRWVSQGCPARGWFFVGRRVVCVLAWAMWRQLAAPYIGSRSWVGGSASFSGRPASRSTQWGAWWCPPGPRAIEGGGGGGSVRVRGGRLEGGFGQVADSAG